MNTANNNPKRIPKDPPLPSFEARNTDSPSPPRILKIPAAINTPLASETFFGSTNGGGPAGCGYIRTSMPEPAPSDSRAHLRSAQREHQRAASTSP